MTRHLPAEQPFDHAAPRDCTRWQCSASRTRPVEHCCRIFHVYCTVYRTVGSCAHRGTPCGYQSSLIHCLSSFRTSLFSSLACFLQEPIASAAYVYRYPCTGGFNLMTSVCAVSEIYREETARDLDYQPLTPRALVACNNNTR